MARDSATGLIFMLNNRTYTSDTPTRSCGNVMAFSVGDTFQSYEELSERIREFEAQNHLQLYHRDSITLQGAKKRAPSRVEKANVSLKYFTIDLACLFGGKGYNAKGKGLRHHKRYICSLKQLCMKLTSH